MNAAFFDAMKAPATLEKREKGREVLVRTRMIQYIMETCDAIDEGLAQIPALLKKYGLAEYDTEPVQRAIIQDGFTAVQVAVRDNTLARLEKAGLFPKVRQRLASENMDAIPQGLREELSTLVGEIHAYNKDLDTPVDFETLWFRSGKLRIAPKYREAVAPRFTLEVSHKDRETVEKIRQAAALLSELKERGVRIADSMRVSPADGKAYQSPGLLTRMASGSGYTDAELLGLLHGLELTH